MPTPIDQRDMVRKTWEGLLLSECLLSLKLWKSPGGGWAGGCVDPSRERTLAWRQDSPGFESKLCHFLTV